MLGPENGPGSGLKKSIELRSNNDDLPGFDFYRPNYISRPVKMY